MCHLYQHPERINCVDKYNTVKGAHLDFSSSLTKCLFCLFSLLNYRTKCLMKFSVWNDTRKINPHNIYAKYISIVITTFKKKKV